ncbi:MAG: hypothetical protein FGM61_12840 [Sediminibacterium sp.]|nr:hypothetical protein [Sediminibacterium sp.]
MKTNLSLTLAIGIIALQTMFIGCQKQEVISTPLANTNLVQAVKGDSAINGLIVGSAAKELSASFIQQRGNQETRLVKIAVKDLINYMHQMQTNALSDSLGIHFGYYTSSTVPAQYPEYLNKYTLYFSVYPAAGSVTPGFKSLGTGDNNTYLNHGTLYP